MGSLARLVGWLVWVLQGDWVLWVTGSYHGLDWPDWTLEGPLVGGLGTDDPRTGSTGYAASLAHTPFSA